MILITSALMKPSNGKQDTVNLLNSLKTPKNFIPYTFPGTIVHLKWLDKA